MITHSKTHWQTPDTMIEYVKKILVPYKNDVIANKNLSANQEMVLKLDLHYSHLGTELLTLFRECNIIPVYVPGRCTDELQECDVVVNKPYKNAVAGAFRDYTQELFNCHVEAGLDPLNFQINLNMGTLKIKIYEFVEKGIKAIKTNEMRFSIKECFATNGCLAQCRSEEFYRESKLLMPASENVAACANQITSEAADVPENLDCNEEEDEEEIESITEIEKNNGQDKDEDEIEVSTDIDKTNENHTAENESALQANEEASKSNKDLTLRIATNVWKRTRKGRATSKKV